MNELKLFPDSNGNIIRAYMSSALTGFPSRSPNEEMRKRESVLKLNHNIQVLCKDLDVSLYLPQDSSNPASSHDDGLNPDEVYFLDRWRIAESHFMILNAENLSFGVGQEMEIANSIGVPTIIFFKKGNIVSRMIKGAPCIFVPDGYNKADSYIEYSGEEDLFNQLRDRINILKKSLEFDRKNIDVGESFSKKFKDIRESRGLSHKELSEITGFSRTFLNLLETEIDYFKGLAREKKLNNQDFFESDSKNRFTNPGLYILEKLSKAFEIEVHQLLPSAPNLFNFTFVDIYKEALLETKPNVEQLFAINSKLNFDFHRKVAAFDGDSSLTKEVIVSEIRNIMNNDKME